MPPERRPGHPTPPRARPLLGVALIVAMGASFAALDYSVRWLGASLPVPVTLLAAWLLKEHVRPARWALVGLAFAGARVVIRPGSGLFGWAVLFPLGCAVTYASFQVLTSRLSALEDPLTTHFRTGLVGTAIPLPLLLASGIDVRCALAAATPLQWAVLVAAGCSAPAATCC